jgi:hypothetical protein
MSSVVFPTVRTYVRISSHAPDILPDEFPQSGYHVRTFPRFRKSIGHFHQSCLTFGVPLNFVGCPPDFIPKYGARTRVRGTAHELRPSPSFLIRPSGMDSDNSGSPYSGTTMSKVGNLKTMLLSMLEYVSIVTRENFKPVKKPDNKSLVHNHRRSWLVLYNVIYSSSKL